MGSQNRDYMQDDYETKGPSWGHDVPTTKWLVIVTVIVFFLQTLLTHKEAIQVQGRQSVAVFDQDSGSSLPPAVNLVSFQDNELQVSYVEEWLPLEADKVLHGQIWRLITYVFCHNRFSPFLVVFNVLTLWFFGSVLERMYGSRELLWFYLAAGLVSGLVFTAVGMKMNLPLPLMGAGPCVMALFTLYATHFPRQEILFCFVVPVQIRVLLAIYVAVDIHWLTQGYSGSAPWVTILYLTTELWGIVFGYAYRRMNWRLSSLSEFIDFQKLRRSFRRATSPQTLKVFKPEPVSNLDEQVDTILAKIHEHGSESLTERERFILQKASEQAKNRL